MKRIVVRWRQTDFLRLATGLIKSSVRERAIVRLNVVLQRAKPPCVYVSAISACRHAWAAARPSEWLTLLPVFDIRIWRFAVRLFLRPPIPLCSTQSRSYTARMPDTHPCFINAVVARAFELRVFQPNCLIDDPQALCGPAIFSAYTRREFYSKKYCRLFATEELIDISLEFIILSFHMRYLYFRNWTLLLKNLPYFLAR